MPVEIYAMSGKKLEKKLRNRRNGLLQHAINYYRFLAYKAYVIGTDEEEHFKVSQNGDKLVVTVFRKGSQNKSDIIYQRTFDKTDTRQIHMMGLGGNDSFTVDESVSSPIELVDCRRQR